ncbi:M23 family metallopeptidase [Altererythrobacter lauratis]|uniref:M23 family metallopeptidase n=1 Tax=Alteraurantiacibacter lauratis TaxID=2054627 RepID=A0ABV7EEI6_9SPHN
MIIKSILGFAAALTLGATPAFANDALVPASASISAAIEAADTGISASPDQEFGDLFASWGELANGGQVTTSGTIIAAPRLGVSIPSRAPLDNMTLTSSYGMRTHPVLGGRRQHNGIDLAAPTGTPVYATADGRVSMAQWYSSYGNYVQIEHGGSLQTRYAHLSAYTVSDGDMVRKGDLIGYVGSTGRSTGPHLHYEVRVDNVAVDPTPYMMPQYAELRRGEGGRGGD